MFMNSFFLCAWKGKVEAATWQISVDYVKSMDRNKPVTIGRIAALDEQAHYSGKVF
jgi:hypothetical protein